MPSELRLTAVGDILISHKIIASTGISRTGQRDFAPLFRHAAPILRLADLTIGNLEIPLAGPEERYTRKSEATGFYTFNAPDELAPALKDAGFDVLVTANNHCLDRGLDGLRRTLDVLDSCGLSHTGTYRTAEEASVPLIREVNGIRVGMLAYSKSTNKIPIPPGYDWCVDLLDEDRMLREVRALRPLCDVLVVCPHWGREYTHRPVEVQRRLMRRLLSGGADVVLGSHPHVIQPALRTPKQAALYSLGNFISPTLMNNPATRSGLIFSALIVKEEDGTVWIRDTDYVPTWTRRLGKGPAMRYEVVPALPTWVSAGKRYGLSRREERELAGAARHTMKVLRTPVMPRRGRRDQV
ncbi:MULTISPECIES: CapA family protein [Paenibacillus]|uniref:CapA family protein n=1 Tax=Paenibacillus TaxID=44249 RepID=UPI0022B8D2C9|nr:CapA family protein [Paenibacillus caseinilyticus]MCZ8518146.1 CapA family protein [Paenibacillus caseinilyticus]